MFQDQILAGMFFQPARDLDRADVVLLPVVQPSAIKIDRRRAASHHLGPANESREVALVAGEQIENDVSGTSAGTAAATGARPASR